MIAAIKEICIFVIIAQAVMFFVPGNSYMKYVRVLVGIMMILKITEPIFGLFLDEEKEQEIRERILELEENIDLSSEGFETEDRTMSIYESIEEELKNRLSECESGYEVSDVSITDENKLLVTLFVKEAETKEERSIQIAPVAIGDSAAREVSVSPETEEELKTLFADCIGVEKESIELAYTSA